MSVTTGPAPERFATEISPSYLISSNLHGGVPVTVKIDAAPIFGRCSRDGVLAVRGNH